MAKYGGAAAALGGAAFTGGASLAGLAPALSIGGKMVSDMAGGAAANRSEKDAFNQNADRNAVTARGQDVTQAAQAADVAFKNQTQARNNSDTDYRQALLSALAMNTKDASFNMPDRITKFNFSGGARPSALGAQGQAAAEAMNNLALQRLMNPDKAVELGAVDKFAASEPTKASFWEKLAGPLGVGAQVLGGALANQGPTAKASDVVDADLLALTKANTFQPSSVLKNQSNVRF